MKFLIFSLRALHLCVIFVFLCSPAVADQIVHAPFSSEQSWEFNATGPYEGWSDRRELFTIHHPWAASKANQFGAVTKELTVPADWTGRVRVHFYMTDDYDAQAAPLPKNAWVGQIKLIGHRFKQLLIDDQVVWEVDVADAEGAAETSRFNVLLPERIKPGQRCRITFRMIDKVASDQRLPEDFRHIGETDSNETDEWKLMTHLYVGDVAITPETTESIPAAESPVMKKVRELHAKNWPIKSLSPKPEFPIQLNWEGVDEIDGLECVIHCGIPLPPGMIKDARQVMLRDGEGKELVACEKTMNRWPDGSVRWVEIDAIALACRQNRKLRMEVLDGVPVCGPDTRPWERLMVSDHFIVHETLQISTGKEGTDLIIELGKGRHSLKHLTGQIEIDNQTYQCVVETRKVLSTGAIKPELELKGHIQREGAPPVGRFTFRIAAFIDQPYVRINWRVFNDRAERLKITRLELVGKYETTESAVSYWGRPGKHAKNDVLLRQPATQPFEVIADANKTVDSGGSARGFLAIIDADNSLLVQVRHFHEQAPKAIELKDGQLRIALFEATKDEPAYEPMEGEAKRHEIWLGLWDKPLSDEEMDKWSRYFARPARLFNAKYFAESGGLGHAASAENNFPDLLATLREQYGEIPASLFYKTGIRHWGDMPYNIEKNQWCNGYYDRQQGMAAAYLIAGDPRWFDHLEATVRHIIDVDICHASKAHPEWIDMIHGYHGADHASEAPWYPQQRMKGALSYWLLTGDLDARDAALGLADAAIRHKYGIGSASVREQAGTFYSIMAAYDETGDAKYLEGAKALAHDIIAHTDRRRGCYSEVHGTLTYRGNVPWMDVQASEPMYDYYCASGDIDAALAVVGFAESIVTENCTPGVPGDIFGYSHNPHFNKTSAYHIAIAPAILYAYELTGDAEFLAHGRAMLPQTLTEKTLNPVQNCFWNTPAYLYYLRAYQKN